MRLHERALILVVTVTPWSLASQLLVPESWAFACGLGAFATYSTVVEIVLDSRADDPERDAAGRLMGVHFQMKDGSWVHPDRVHVDRERDQ